MRRRLLVTLAAMLVAAMTLSGCASSARQDAPAPGSGSASPAPAQPAPKPVKDTLVIAQGADAYSMDPAKHSVFPTANILFQIYDPLVTRDEKGQFQPALALSWSNPQPTVWQFKLRQGVKFHNGEEFDAEAVKFTFDRALDPNFKAPYLSRINIIKRVEVVDKYTVNFHTDKPYPTMLFTLYEASFPSLIVPPKYTKEKGNDELAKKPVGTGPYKFVEWVKDDRVVIEANPEYWGGPPKIKKVVWRPISEVRTRVAELKSGGVDIADNIPPEEVQGLSGGKTKVVSVASDFIMFVVMNSIEGGPLANKKVRQALNYAVDVDAIQKSLLGGMGQRINLGIPYDAFGNDKSIQPYPYDPNKAKQLLTEAGYANGFTIPMISRSGRYLKDKEIVEAISGYLSKVGIKVEINFVEGGVWGKISEGHGRKGLSYPGWSGMDADLVWYPILTSGQYQSYFANKDLDALLMEGRTTVDQNKRLEAYKKAAQIIKEEAPHIPLFQPPLIYGVNADLQWSARGDSIIDLRKAEFK